MDGTETIVRQAETTIPLGETRTLLDPTWKQSAEAARDVGKHVGQELLAAGADRLMAASR